jgi:transposase
VKSETAREGRVVLKARAHLVGQRRDTENAIRGLLASLGIRFAKGAAKLGMRVRAALEDHPEPRPAIEPLLSVLAALKSAIDRLDKTVAARAKGDPACRLLMTVPGVGPVTALAYVATIGDAERFASSRAVGAYVGLTSRRWQSGERDYSGRISKMGDAMPRSLLYEAANSLLTVVRRAHPLKDWARRIRKRTSHKKACVALARKLAVILHRMLITGEAFRWPEKEVAETA